MPRIEVQPDLLSAGGARQSALAAHLQELSTQLRSTTADAAAAAGDGAAGGSIAFFGHAWSSALDVLADTVAHAWVEPRRRGRRLSRDRPGRGAATGAVAVPESFAGITVPEGEAGELRSAAKALSGLSHDLESAARTLDGQPTMLGGWAGPASVAYAGACLVSSDGVRASATAAHAAAGALRRFGEGLQDAQRDARHAIAQARAAQHRIDRAQHRSWLRAPGPRPRRRATRRRRRRSR